MSDQSIMGMVLDEVQRAQTEHALDFASDHEAIGVLLEEFEELKAEVWKKREHRDRRAMIHECVQVAAVAIKWAETLQRKLRNATPFDSVDRRDAAGGP